MADKAPMTDKTGAPVTVTRGDGRFAIAVDGKTVGHTAFADLPGQRVFYHTEVDEAFGGRGLATIVIAEALAATRDEGLRIVPVCPTVHRLSSGNTTSTPTSSTARRGRSWTRSSPRRDSESGDVSRSRRHQIHTRARACLA